jgi:hypothetical protein
MKIQITARTWRQLMWLGVALAGSLAAFAGVELAKGFATFTEFFYALVTAAVIAAMALGARFVAAATEDEKEK